MSRDEILARLQAHEDELRRMGVRSLALFGSVARGDDTPESDVDVLVSIEPEAELSLLGMARIERRLGELLGREIDMVEREMLRPAFAREVTRDEMRAF
jgi:predicted nucleotidyltransferase